MADGNRGVSTRPVLEEQRGHGPPDDVGPAHDHGVRPFGLHSTAKQKLLDAVGRRRTEPAGIADGHPTDIFRMEAVYVLLGMHPVQHTGAVHVPR